MSKQKDQMKWVLFWVFLILFVLMVLGTLAMVFLGFGSPTESERELMVIGLIGEVAACVIALFYSIFGLRGEQGELEKLQELEDKTDHALSVLESLKSRNTEPQIASPSTLIQNGEDSPIKRVKEDDFESKVSLLDAEPPFPIQEFELTPLPIDIKTDIQNAKPIDVKHRKSSYKGMKVQWKAILSSVDEKGEGKLNVTADLDEKLIYASFEVDKNSNNTLLVANKEEPFWLCGEIVEVEPYRIDMANVQLKFRGAT